MSLFTDLRSLAGNNTLASRVGTALTGMALLLPVGCSRESEKVERASHRDDSPVVEIDWDTSGDFDFDFALPPRERNPYDLPGTSFSEPSSFSEPFAGVSLPGLNELPLEQETPQLYSQTIQSVVETWKSTLADLECARELSEFWKGSEIEFSISSDVAAPGSNVQAIATPPLAIEVDAEAFSQHCAVALAETVGRRDPKIAISLYEALLTMDDDLTPEQHEKRLHDVVLAELEKLEGKEQELAEFHRRLAEKSLGVVSHELTHLLISLQMKEELGFDFPLACRDEEILCFVQQAQVETALYHQGRTDPYQSIESSAFGSGRGFFSGGGYDTPLASEVVRTWRGGLEGLRGHVEQIPRYAALPMLSEIDDFGDYREKVASLSDGLEQRHALQQRLQEALQGLEQNRLQQFRRVMKSDELGSMIEAFDEAQALLSDPEKVEAISQFYRSRLVAAEKER